MKDFGDKDFIEYYTAFFRKRITDLRMAKKVSEREISLSLGKTPSYINQIVAGTNLPEFENFFAICEYFGITPGEFFIEGCNPIIEKELYQELNKYENGAEIFLKAIKKINYEHLAALLKVLGDI